MNKNSGNGAAWLAGWAAVATAVVTVGLALLAAQQLRHAARIRDEENRPYVIVDFEFRSFLSLLAIKNIGRTMALRVRINFDKPLTSTVSRPLEIDEARVFNDSIPMIAPGRTISVLFDSFPARASNLIDMPMTYAVQLTYQDVRGQPLQRSGIPT